VRDSNTTDLATFIETVRDEFQSARTEARRLSRSIDKAIWNRKPAAPSEIKRLMIHNDRMSSRDRAVRHYKKVLAAYPNDRRQAAAEWRRRMQDDVRSFIRDEDSRSFGVALQEITEAYDQAMHADLEREAISLSERRAA